MRGLRVAWTFFRIGSLNELQYRVNFFVHLLQSGVAVATALIVLRLVYSHTDDLNGWSESELLVVMGIQILLGGLAAQAAWTIGLTGILLVFWRVAVKRYSAVGN